MHFPTSIIMHCIEMHKFIYTYIYILNARHKYKQYHLMYAVLLLVDNYVYVILLLKKICHARGVCHNNM